jgi:hypothetical protein
MSSDAGRPDAIVSEVGKELFKSIREAYAWKEKYPSTNDEFMGEMSQLFVKCTEHMTDLSANPTLADKQEADQLVKELMELRIHWGPNLFPPRMNAMGRESMAVQGRSGKVCRIDSAQYFEPVPYYENSQDNFGELMKLYRFTVYDTTTNDIVMRYFLERSNLGQLHHVLCYAHPVGGRGQIKPYFQDCPSYWELREQVIDHVIKNI